MFDRLKLLKNQYEELCRRMEEPETYSVPSVYARYDREARELAPVVEAYTAYERAGNDMAAAREMMEDPELRAFSQEEFAAAKAEPNVAKALEGKTICKEIYVPGKLVNIAVR